MRRGGSTRARPSSVTKRAAARVKPGWAADSASTLSFAAPHRLLHDQLALEVRGHGLAVAGAARRSPRRATRSAAPWRRRPRRAPRARAGRAPRRRGSAPPGSAHRRGARAARPAPRPPWRRSRGRLRVGGHTEIVATPPDRLRARRSRPPPRGRRGSAPPAAARAFPAAPSLGWGGMIQRAMRRRSSSRRSTLSSSRSSPERPGSRRGRPPPARPASRARDRASSPCSAAELSSPGRSSSATTGASFTSWPACQAGEPQAAGHLLEAHLATVVVGAGRRERAARHARGSGRLDARPLGLGSGCPGGRSAAGAAPACGSGRARCPSSRSGTRRRIGCGGRTATRGTLNLAA